MQRLIIVTTIAMAFSGCGGGSSSDPRKVAEQYRNALAESDSGKACSLMTSESKQGLVEATKTKSCEAAFKQALDLLDAGDREQLAKVKVKSVKTEGDKATVTLT